MLVVLLCIMMKILEFSSNHGAACDNNKAHIRLRRRRKRRRGAAASGARGGGMTEEGCHAPATSPASSDCNSNHQEASVASNASSSQDADFLHDNSDYQWFLDYGYRDGGTREHQPQQHASVLSASYGCDEEGYYSDLARNIDANLAEVDMETFRSEDINCVLAALPVMCCAEMQVERQGEMYASVSGSMMAKFDFDSSISPHTSSQNDSAGSTDTMSICKSELLFSPVRECPMPATNFSVDSLDCDHDILLTCQANKDNYTIAFEGSLALCSEDSDYHEPGDSGRTSQSSAWARHCFKVRGGGGRPLDTSMACSDSAYTTWSKLKKQSSEVQLARHPSGNNNASPGLGAGDTSALKSHSMPDLYRRRARRRLLLASMTSSAESEPRVRPVKLYDRRRGSGSPASDASSSVDGGRRHGFSLVRLFMKQRSGSSEGVCYAMDQSSASECWPASANSQSENDSDSYMQGVDVATRNEMNAASHAWDGCDNVHDCTDIIGDGENGNGEDTKAAVTVGDDVVENSTCGFEDSLMEPSRKDTQFQQHELIAEETEEERTSEQSESVEQLSESFSKIEESLMDTGGASCLSDRVEEPASSSHENNNYGEKRLAHFSVNNNDSAGSAELSARPRCRRTQTRQGSASSRSSTAGSISNCSSSDETDTTKLHRPPLQAGGRCTCNVRNSAATHAVRLMNRSMQTSGHVDVKSTPFRLVESPGGRSLVQIIKPTFDGKLGPVKEGEVLKPLYVLFPNYTLPDLSFLREKRKEIDISNVFLIPQHLGSMSPLKDFIDGNNEEESTRKKKSPLGKSPRPFSCNDVEALKKKGFGHVKDWDSLTFLLPKEYCQFLSEMPEVIQHVKGKEKDAPQPLFCVSPPLHSRAPRPASCDCGSFTTAQSAGNVATNVSSSSSTATQPSSGYRGSSTMLLTDSSSNHPMPGNYNPLFVYRYDSVSSESSMVGVPQPNSKKHPPVLPERSISLPVHKDTCPGKTAQHMPPRPPLPRGILRKSFCSGYVKSKCKAHKSAAGNKRYSMFELGGDQADVTVAHAQRSSLHDTELARYLASLRRCGAHISDEEQRLFEKKLLGRLSPEKDVDERENEDYDDEGVDAGTDSSFEDGCYKFEARPPTPPIPKTPDTEESPLSSDKSEEVLKLEEFLHLSGLSIVGSGDGSEAWTEGDATRLRAQVSKFLLRRRDNSPRCTEDCDCKMGVGSKKVSFAEKVCVRLRDDAAGQGTAVSTPPNSPAVVDDNNYKKCQGKHDSRVEVRPAAEQPAPVCGSPGSLATIHMPHKRGLVTAVSDAVEEILGHFAAARSQDHCAQLGSSEQTPACAQLVLSQLCPALYAVLGDGLKTSLDTIFGSIGNSVWQVVEVSAQQGVMTKHLNELVLRINSEDVLTEGRVKFNTFVFGLLNVRSLDAWVSYLRTRESIIRKHYAADSLFLLATTAGASVHALLDQLVASLQPLSLLPFRLDLLFESKQLHLSLRRMDAYQQPTPAPDTSPKPWTFRKLVRSIQNSLTQSFEDDVLPSWNHRGGRSPPKGTLDESPLPDLLDSSVNVLGSKEDRPRPRSCVDGAGAPGPNGGFSLVSDLASTVRMRWSGIQLGSKLFQAFDRLTADEAEDEYPDSLENNPRLERKRQGSGSSSNSTGEDCTEVITRDSTASPVPGAQDDVVAEEVRPAAGSGRFRKLQMKWEMLSGKESCAERSSSPATSPQSQASGGSTPSSGGVGRSRIPRLVTSPVRASGIPVPCAPGPAKRAATSQLPKPRQEATVEVVPARSSPGMIPRRVVPAAARCSRLDQLQGEGKPTRPSSLPYKAPTTAANTRGAVPGRRPEQHRRAASSSLSRQKPTATGNQPLQRWVRTLCHRLPSDSGHLSFNEGERLRVVLDVDAQWLLCCRGDHKGLVPRSAVIPLHEMGPKV